MPITPAPEPFRLSLSESNNGSDVLVYASATGCGIYLLQRIIVSTQSGGSTTCRYFRPGGFFDFEVGGAQIEPNITILKARVPAPPGAYTASADGNYVRVDRRATTRVENF